ncbi:DUF5703 domain-containing protein [Dinghuibacter silviterrae]|uniref:DUF5703 domain-containing protein n=1 Tax=Dinghuibacter silviterrae TaxID=1539049 RepID=A0A4R8DVA6_9BACT|nr:DUF5703 domain-containing protein [Dinghuibacter silviterrae]TDX01405.1 hypothetical protein EDB95_2440 [Dinghuibacter silviterrae]
MLRLLICGAVLLTALGLKAQRTELSYDNIVWTRPGGRSDASMPCGGGDIGLNVWVEKGDLLCYVARSGTFDENNSLLKLGRIRVHLTPFDTGTFRQTLDLREGCVRVEGRSVSVLVWVDVFRPVVHIAVHALRPVQVQASWESWRYRDRPVRGSENNQDSYRWAPPFPVVTFRDSIAFAAGGVLFWHRNRDTPSVFDQTVRQQGLSADSLYNPLKDLTFGGVLRGVGLYPSGTDTGTYASTDFKRWTLAARRPLRATEITLACYTAQAPTIGAWQDSLAAAPAAGRQATLDWWHAFWDRSFIFIRPGEHAADSADWQAGRNYQLFRYMLGCNAFGSYPTKFNGGLFTYDPVYVDSTLPFTPDFRKWGGGTFTAQNQRLVYYPMLANGDTDLLLSQFAFYQRLLGNASYRTRAYWGHEGACFTEQLENFGLPNYAEYGTKRPAGFDPGLEYNAWLEYEWDTVLEFCFMILEEERYTGIDIHRYLPLIESCLTFFDQHYRLLAQQRGRKALDGEGHLILYPGSAGETYKMAYDASSTIAGLRVILARLQAIPYARRDAWAAMLRELPPLSFRSFDGHTTIAPAKVWERVNNTETPQLYPVFPWGLFGIGRPGFDTALNTYRYDTDAVRFSGYVGWKQDNIFAARLGLAGEAFRLTVAKLRDAGRPAPRGDGRRFAASRDADPTVPASGGAGPIFPAFWGPGYDWAPDHNWGGSGMIGLQEMLLQSNGRAIYLFPAWPLGEDVHFRLHAPYNTTVEARVRHGVADIISVTPENRRKDIVNMYGQ